MKLIRLFNKMDVLCELCVCNSWDGTVCTMLPRMVTL